MYESNKTRIILVVFLKIYIEGEGVQAIFQRIYFVLFLEFVRTYEGLLFPNR